MKIIIDIPESTYRIIKYGNSHLTERDASNIINAIKNADNEFVAIKTMPREESEEE